MYQRQFFKVLFLDEADRFLSGLQEKVREKILYNVMKASMTNDPGLFKKLDNDIWEFRTRYNGVQYRLLAFWDKSGEKKTLVVATHGLMKKRQKMQMTELDKARRMKGKYFKQIGR